MNNKLIIFLFTLALFLVSFALAAYMIYKQPAVQTASPAPGADSTVSGQVYSSEVLGVEKKPSLRLMAVGDIMLARSVGKRIAGDYEAPFSEINPILHKADILFGNLESPISDRGSKLQGKKIAFRAKPEAVSSLTYAGFDVLSLANNHILDYSTPALLQTLDILEEKKIQYCGAGKDINEARKPAVINHFGLRVAFLAYTDMYDIYYSSRSRFVFEAADNRAGVAPRKLDYIIEDIKSAKDTADLVVVSLHWGIEESFNVTNEMRKFAHNLVDSGADFILGHHPHQIQGLEVYKGKPIAYSLGNFIFDQNDIENNDSIILNLEYDFTRLVSVEAIPLRIVDKMKVVPAPAGRREIIQNRLIELSDKLDTNGYIDKNSVKFNIPE